MDKKKKQLGISIKSWHKIAKVQKYESENNTLWLISHLISDVFPNTVDSSHDVIRQCTVQAASQQYSEQWNGISFVSLSASVLRHDVSQYRGADKSLTRPTSRCILFDGENISFDASLVIYIYIYVYM